jgi:hypothetical protein
VPPTDTDKQVIRTSVETSKKLFFTLGQSLNDWKNTATESQERWFDKAELPLFTFWAVCFSFVIGMALGVIFAI